MDQAGDLSVPQTELKCKTQTAILAQIVADGFEIRMIESEQHKFAWPREFEANLRVSRQDMNVSRYDSAHIGFAVCRAL
jgi:hypothetical protein